jgi:hypothetical protein
MAVAPDGTVAVYDFDRRGLIRFAPDGTPLPEVVIPGAVQRKVEVTSFGLLAATRIVGTASDTTLLLALAGDDTIRVAMLANEQPKAVELGGCMRVAMPSVFSPAIVWTARGDTIGANVEAAYAIRVHESDRPVAIYRREIAPLRADAPLAARELGGDSMRFVAGTIRCAISAERAAESIGFAEVAPHIRNLMLAPDGTWWVQRRVTGPERNRIDVLARDGEYLGTLAPDFPWPAAFRGADEIVAVERDDLDVARVVVYRLVRGG